MKPLCFRLLGVDVCLGGPPIVSHIHTLSDLAQPSTESAPLYPNRGQVATASPRGYYINSRTRVIAHGRAAYLRAARALETGDALHLPWVRFWRRGRGSRWEPGDAAVVASRFLPFIWTVNVNHVLPVERRRNHLAVSWGTSRRSVLRGEERVAISMQRNGDVVFSLRSFSRPHAVLAYLLYPVVIGLQHIFAKDVCTKLQRIANDEDYAGNANTHASLTSDRGIVREGILRGSRHRQEDR